METDEASFPIMKDLWSNGGREAKKIFSKLVGVEGRILLGNRTHLVSLAVRAAGHA